MSDRVWTVKDLLDTARRYLEEKDIENPRGNVEALLGKALNLPRIELYLQHERPLTDSELGVFRELLRRRAKREPLQLILGSVEFCGVRIEVRPGVLIPRPETEELTERLIALLAQSANSPLRILDLGSGSGCIAVALAKRFSSTVVDAVDVDFEAVRLTSHNAEANGVGERVRALLCDVFLPRFLNSVTPPYDVVVSNPPYVTGKDYASLAAEIRDHEPKRALTAGEDGLMFHRRITKLLPELLTLRGTLMLEIGETQGAAVREMIERVMQEVCVERDLSGHDRFVTGKLRRG